MAKVRDEHKAQLIAAGKWPDFVLFKDNCRLSGMSPSRANKDAIQAYLGDEAAALYGFNGARKKDKIPSPPPTPPVPELPAGAVGGDLLNGSLSTPDYSGRQASPMEWVLWVARKVAPMTAPLDDCPDQGAMNLLVAVRSSPAFAVEFWRTFISKAITKDSGPEPEEVDGTVLRGTIDRILKLAESAVEQSRGGQVGKAPDSCSGIAGSSPAPATIPEGAK